MIDVALSLDALSPISEIVLLGDYADFYSVSRHQKDPRVKALLLDEVESVREGLDELDRLFPRAKKVYLEGNHEKRLEAYLIEKAPEIFGVTQLEFLFGLNQRPLWHFSPFGRSQKHRILGSDLFAFHRPKNRAPGVHIEKTGVSSVYGDVHKIERAHRETLDGRSLVSLCPGWLGDVSSRVFDYMPCTPQWQQGFAIVSVDDSSGNFHIEQVEIKNHSCLVGGQIFYGK